MQFLKILTVPFYNEHTHFHFGRGRWGDNSRLMYPNIKPRFLFDILSRQLLI